MRRREMALSAIALAAVVWGGFCQGDASGEESVKRIGAGQSPWVTPPVRAPGLQYHLFESDAAGAKISYHVYVPPVYETAKDRRFPVLYWLHGRGGGWNGLRPLAAHFDRAIRDGKIPPVLVVFPNGMADTMWCDSKDGTIPLETVIVEELVPQIDAAFRTIASREGRMVEGFSMGGYGAARLGLKHHDVFGAASVLGAGPLQREFSPEIGPSSMARVRRRVFQRVYGGDQDYFKAQSPWVLAEQNAEAAGGRLRLRLVIGSRDGLLDLNRDFHAHLTRLNVPHTFEIVPNVGHDTLALLDGLGDANWAFYREVFEGVEPQTSAFGPKTHSFARFVVPEGPDKNVPMGE